MFTSLIGIIAALGLTVISTIGSLLVLAGAIMAFAGLVNLFGRSSKVAEQKPTSPPLPLKAELQTH